VNRYEAMVALVSIICGTILISTLFAGIAKVIFARRRNRDLPETTAVAIDDRLARMEQAMDAMSVEMERISENQRFTTKLLSDRAVERVPSRVG
jgi:hypothetical protein